MLINFPPEIISKRLGQDVGGFGLRHDDVMLEAVVADVLHEFLELGHFGHGAVAEGLQHVIGQFAFADVGADAAVRVRRGDAAVSERAGGRAAIERAVGVLHADGRADDGRVGNFDVGQK